MTSKKRRLQSGFNHSTAYVDIDKAGNRLSSLQSLPVQLCAPETHIRISRTLKKFVDLMRNHRSGPEPSPSHLQAHASYPKRAGNLIVGGKSPTRHA